MAYGGLDALYSKSERIELRCSMQSEHEQRYKTIAEAANGFSADRIVGSGGFATVCSKAPLK